MNEMFAVPVNLEKVANISGVDLYSSKNLKVNFLMSIYKTAETKNIRKKLHELVKSETIIPCFLGKNILTSLKIKLFDPHDLVLRELKHVCGFFDPVSKKIIILIDPNINIVGFASNKQLARFVLHECIHLLANKNPSKFLSIYSSDLNKFYFELFNILFDFKERPEKEVSNVLNFLFKNEVKYNRSNSMLKDLHSLLIKSFSKYSGLDDTAFYRTINDYITIVKVYFKDIVTFYRLSRYFNYILGPIYQSYQEVFNFSPSFTKPIQELFNPSEVICLLSEVKPDSRTYSAIKSL